MHDEWRQYWKRLIRQLGWAKWSLLIALVFFGVNFPQLAPERRWHSFGISLIWAGTIYAWVFVSYGFLYAWVVWRKIKTGIAIVFSMPAHVLVGVSASSAGVVMSLWLEARWNGVPFLLREVPQSILTGIFISLMFTFYSAFKKSQERSLQLEAERARAELHALQAQMQPHFLFNSLNSLAELIDSDHTRAVSMAQMLADLYREILFNSKVQTASVKTELEIARKYLELESIRFGKRLNF